MENKTMKIFLMFFLIFISLNLSLVTSFAKTQKNVTLTLKFINKRNHTVIIRNIKKNVRKNSIFSYNPTHIEGYSKPKKVKFRATNNRVVNLYYTPSKQVIYWEIRSKNKKKTLKKWKQTSYIGAFIASKKMKVSGYATTYSKSFWVTQKVKNKKIEVSPLTSTVVFQFFDRVSGMYAANAEVRTSKVGESISTKNKLSAYNYKKKTVEVKKTYQIEKVFCDLKSDWVRGYDSVYPVDSSVTPIFRWSSSSEIVDPNRRYTNAQGFTADEEGKYAYQVLRSSNDQNNDSKIIRIDLTKKGYTPMVENNQSVMRKLGHANSLSIGKANNKTYLFVTTVNEQDEGEHDVVQFEMDGRELKRVRTVNFLFQNGEDAVVNTTLFKGITEEGDIEFYTLIGNTIYTTKVKNSKQEESSKLSKLTRMNIPGDEYVVYNPMDIRDGVIAIARSNANCSKSCFWKFQLPSAYTASIEPYWSKSVSLSPSFDSLLEPEGVRLTKDGRILFGANAQTKSIFTGKAYGSDFVGWLNE